MSDKTVKRRYGVLEPGMLIDERYEIVELLGEGGFASVFKARQVLMDRMVALKLLHARGSSSGAPKFEERFLREARLAGRLRHHNVVTVYDFGVTRDTREPYLVMEYLEGHDLQAELRRFGPMTPARAVPLFCDVLDALHQGHKLGIVHKDLKPSNLYVTAPRTDQEALLVLDFGVARMIHGDSKITGTGEMFGTPQYLAPEYIESQIVKPALDVYQVGLILIEALTGRLVVDATSPYKLLDAHVHGDHHVDERILESPLGPVVQKAIATNLSDRYPDAQTFRSALEEIDLDTLDFDFSGSLSDTQSVSAELGTDGYRIAMSDTLASGPTLAAAPNPDDLAAARGSGKVRSAETAAGSPPLVVGPRRGDTVPDTGRQVTAPATRPANSLLRPLIVVGIVLAVGAGAFGLSSVLFDDNTETTSDAGTGDAEARKPATDAGQAAATSDTDSVEEEPAEPDPEEVAKEALAVVATATRLVGRGALKGAEAADREAVERKKKAVAANPGRGACYFYRGSRSSVSAKCRKGCYDDEGRRDRSPDAYKSCAKIFTCPSNPPDCQPR